MTPERDTGRLVRIDSFAIRRSISDGGGLINGVVAWDGFVRCGGTGLGSGVRRVDDKYDLSFAVASETFVGTPNVQDESVPVVRTPHQKVVPPFVCATVCKHPRVRTPRPEARCARFALLRWSRSVVEHVLGKDGVTGSIPVSSSIRTLCLSQETLTEG